VKIVRRSTDTRQGLVDATADAAFIRAALRTIVTIGDS